MTSHEIVRRCIEFDDPPRIAMSFATLPLEGRIWEFDDFACLTAQLDPDFHPSRPGETEWGIVYENISGHDIGQPRAHPLEKGWHLLDHFPFPDYRKPSRYRGLKEAAAAHHAKGKFVYAPLVALGLTASDLRKFENWLADHLLEPENLGRLLDRIVESNLQLIGRYHEAGIDAVITWDDWGTNERPFLKPDLFRAIYLPRFRRIVDALHERGMYFIHHCCGFVRAYMDLFLEGGWDVLQLDQPCLMGIDWLGENFGGKMAFWCPVDIQRALPRGNPAEIEDEAHHLVWALGQKGGGFMVKAYAQPVTIGTTVSALETQYRSFVKYGHYPLIPYDTKP